MLSTRRKRPSGDGTSRTIIAAAPIGCGSPSSGTRISADCMWYSNSAASDSSLIMSSYVLAGVLRPRLSCTTGPGGVRGGSGAAVRDAGTVRAMSAPLSGVHSNGRRGNV